MFNNWDRMLSGLPTGLRDFIVGVELEREQIDGPPHQCCICDSAFYSQKGGLECHEQTDEKYCPKCVSSFKHVAYIRDYCVGLDQPTKSANQIIEHLKSI